MNFAILSNSVSYLMSFYLILKSSKKYQNIRWLKGGTHDRSDSINLKWLFSGDVQKSLTCIGIICTFYIFAQMLDVGMHFLPGLHKGLVC